MAYHENGEGVLVKNRITHRTVWDCEKFEQCLLVHLQKFIQVERETILCNPTSLIFVPDSTVHRGTINRWI